MGRLGSVSMLALTLAAGCSLTRSPIRAASPIDGGTLDASVPLDAPAALDVPVAPLDAPMVPIDAPMIPIDAPVFPVDAPTLLDTPARLDAPAPVDAPDAPPTPDAGPCASGPDMDGDGVVDACDRCPMDNPDDSDGDSICDSADVCPAFDDGLDGDGDGIPDGCDTWPCGVRPTVPSPVVDGEVSITSFSFSTGGRTTVVAGGASVTMTLGYSIRDCGCAGCIDQIEVGVVPGSRIYCPYDANPMCMTASTGTSTRTFTAPLASGVYDVRFVRAQDFGCNTGGRTDWWLGPPMATNTVGVVCVR